MPKAANVARRSLQQPPKRGDGKAKLTRLNAAGVGFAGETAAVVDHVLQGVALCTRGEASGHGFWCDAEFIASVANATHAGRPLKCRFTHPGLSADGLGKLVGHITGGTADGDVARGDLRFSDIGRDAPDGDLTGYVERLAAAHPSDFGLSIVFSHDRAAEENFLLEHGGEWAVDDWGYHYISLANYQSPDPDNVDNLPHCRLQMLHACDVVDEPAANPAGLFHRGRGDVALAATELADFVFGRSTDKPDAGLFGVDPDRARAFLTRYLDARGLAVGAKENSMPKPAPKKPAAKPSLWARLGSVFGATPTKKPKLSAEQERMLSRVLSKFDDGEEPVPTEDRPPADTSDEPTNTVQTTCPNCGCAFPVDVDTGEAGEPASMDEGDDDKKDAQDDDEKKDGCDAGDIGAKDQQDEGDDDKKSSQSVGRLQQFMKAFGDANGARYFTAGLSFEAAAAKYGVDVRKSLAAKDAKIAKLAAGGEGEDSPVSLGDGGNESDKRKEEAQARLKSDRLSRIAAGCVPKKAA
jgi:hypothetical protein